MTEADNQAPGQPPAHAEPEQPFVEETPTEPGDESAGYEEQPIEGADQQENYAEGEVPVEEQVELGVEPQEPEGPSLSDFAKANKKNYVRRRPNEWVPPKDFKPVIFTEKTNLVVEHENHSAKITAIITGIVVLVCGALLAWYIYADTHREPMPSAQVPPTKSYLVSPTTGLSTMPAVPMTQPAAAN